MNLVKHDPPQGLAQRVAATVGPPAKRALALTSQFTMWLLARTWGGTKRTGRIVLWILFWPAGLFRSLMHGKHKRERIDAQRHAEMLDALKRREV
jgi:hypothetical protein